MGKDQIGITLTPDEREIVEEIAKRLDLPLAKVLREAAMDGLDAWIDRINRREQFLKVKREKNDT